MKQRTIDGMARPNSTYAVTHYAYCGMCIPHGDYEDAADARQEVAELLRRRRRQGFPVVTLERGSAWEIQERDDAWMVNDRCGTLRIEDFEEEPEEWEVDAQDGYEAEEPAEWEVRP